MNLRLLLALLLFGSAGAASEAGDGLGLMPLPRSAALRPGRLAVPDALAAAIRRFPAPFRAPAGSGAVFVMECPPPGSAVPQFGEDESYSLVISPQKAVLRARTAEGAVRGMATLWQLLRRDQGGWFLPAVEIDDSPRFAWRGLMIDVARHWQPAEVIRRNLDGMALVKLNVLHLHLTDDQGFRIEVKSHPELAAKGSDGHFYTREEMRGIIAYAAERGIRVVPEFDLPAHATSWLVSHPELASGPGPYQIERHWGPRNPVMDPTNEAVYRLLTDVLTEMAAVFPDPYLHIGGDENNGVQWGANARIQAFIRERGLGGNLGLQVYFARRMESILARLGKRPIGWDEILSPDLPRNAVIESWRDSAALGRVARLGFQGILANGYYVDLCHSAAEYYLSDPLPPREPSGPALTPRERSRVLGGEASMWGEWVTPETIDSRIWPATAAIAERLWSPAQVRDVPDMYRRLAIMSAALTRLGLRHESYRGPFLHRLLSGDDNPETFAALSALLEAVGPVRGLARYHQQPGVDERTPLTGIADAAAPDGPAAREFADEVFAWLASPRLNGAETGSSIRASLLRWTEAGELLSASGGPALRAPGLAESAAVADELADASRLGLEALGCLQAGRAPPAGWQAEAAVRLASDAEPHFGAEVAVLPAIRSLVAAASRPAGE